MNYTEIKELTHVSVSQVETYRECPRKHFYQYVLGNRQESTKAQEYGKKCHDILERYLKGEITKEEISQIKYHGATVLVGLDELPNVENPYVEEKFELFSKDLKSKVLGFIDYFHIEEEENKAILIDHKIVKNDNYLLDSEKLFNKNQIIVYSKFIIDTYDVDVVEAYYYYYKRGGQWLKKVKTTLTKENINTKYNNFINSAIDCENNYNKKLNETVQHLMSCQKWAGCPFKSECWGEPKMSDEKSFFERLQEMSENDNNDSLEKEESIFEEISNSDEKDPTVLLSGNSQGMWGSSFISQEDQTSEYIDTTVDDNELNCDLDESLNDGFEENLENELEEEFDEEFDNEFHDLEENFEEEDNNVLKERKEMNIFTENIENFNLSNRTRNSLVKAGFTTLSDAFMFINENNTFEMFCNGTVEEADFRQAVDILKTEVRGFGSSCVDDLIDNIKAYLANQSGDLQNDESLESDDFSEYESELNQGVSDETEQGSQLVEDQVEGEQISEDSEVEEAKQDSVDENNESHEQESSEITNESAEEKSEETPAKVLLLGTMAVKGMDCVMLEDVLNPLEKEIQQKNEVPHISLMQFNKGYDQLAGVISMLSWEDIAGNNAICVNLTSASIYNRVVVELTRKADIVISRS